MIFEKNARKRAGAIVKEDVFGSIHIGKPNKSKKAKIAADPSGIVNVKLNGGVDSKVGRNWEGVAKLGSGVRLTEDAVFKVPPLPTKKTGVGIGIGGDQICGSDIGDARADAKGEKSGRPADETIEKANKLVCSTFDLLIVSVY